MFLNSKKSQLKEVLKSARNEKIAVGQFNFSSMDQLRGIAQAAAELQTSVICGTSVGEAEFFGIEEAVALTRVIKEKAPLFLNLDHGKEVEVIKRAINAGYDMVHFDGSHLPLEENIKKTKEVVAYAKKRGVVVEGEVSKISGKSAVFKEKMEEVSLTSLEKVVRFIKETGVDCIALDVGNVHGVYAEAPRLHPERVDNLLKKIFCWVVLHGGSGIKDEDLRDVIERGVVKININTELRSAWREGLDRVLSEKPEEIVPYKLLPSVQDDVYKKVKEKINLFSRK